MKNIKYLLLCSLLASAGCSDNGFLFRSIGSYDTPEHKGVYLVGAPYEVDGVKYTPKEDYDYFDSGNASWFKVDPDHPLTANGELADDSKMTAMHRTLPLPSVIRLTNLNNQMSALIRVNDRGPYDNNRIIDVSKAAADYLNFSKSGVTPVQIEIMVRESQNLKKEMLAAKQSAAAANEETVLNSDKILYPGLNNKDIENLTLSKKKATPYAAVQEKEQTVSADPAEEQAVQPVSKKAASPGILYAGSGDTPKYYVQIGAFAKEDSVQKIQKTLSGYNNLFVTNRYKNGQLLHYVRIGPYKTEAESTNVLDKVQALGYADAAVVFE